MTEPSNSIRVQAQQHSEIISISGNTARMRFAGKMWDVTIEDNGKGLAFDQRLADAVQSLFEQLHKDQVFTSSQKSVTVEGHHNPDNAEQILIDKVQLKDSPAGPSKDVAYKTSSAATQILQTLGQHLCHATPWQGSPKPLAQGADPSVDASSDSEPPFTLDDVKDPLQEQFLTRNVNVIQKPMDLITARWNPYRSFTKEHLAKTLADVDKKKIHFGFIPWGEHRGQGFEKDPKFNWIQKEMEHLAAVSPQKEARFAPQLIKFKISKDQLSDLIQNNAPTEEERKLLVNIYAEYINSTADIFDAGPYFYKICLDVINQSANPLKKLIVLEKGQADQLQISEELSSDNADTVSGDNTLFMYYDSSERSLNSYQEAASDGLLPLDQIDSLGKTTKQIIIHEDLKDAKTSALRALALQALALKGQSAPSKAQTEAKMLELRQSLPEEDLEISDEEKQKILASLRSTSSYKSTMKKDLESLLAKSSDNELKDDIKKLTPHLYEKLALQAQTKAEETKETLLSSSEKKSSDLLRKAIKDLTTKIDQEMQALKDDEVSIENVREAYIEELKHNQERDFDKIAFRLLQNSYQIAVLENSTNKKKPLLLKQENFYANETTLHPSNCLLLWRGKKGRYRSVCRDQKILTTKIETP